MACVFGAENADGVDGYWEGGVFGDLGEVVSLIGLNEGRSMSIAYQVLKSTLSILILSLDSLLHSLLTLLKDDWVDIVSECFEHLALLLASPIRPPYTSSIALLTLCSELFAIFRGVEAIPSFVYSQPRSELIWGNVTAAPEGRIISEI